VQSPFEFQRVGKLGVEMNTLFHDLAGHADKICFYRGLQAESVNHPTALYHLKRATASAAILRSVRG
jgi:hypothetical protein